MPADLQGGGWARDLSARSIKKRLKLRALDRGVADLAGLRCLEHGAETGVVCAYLRDTRGGDWTAACLDPEWVPAAGDLLGAEAVRAIDPETDLPWPDGSFGVVLVSRPEHVLDDGRMFREAARVLREDGRLYVTTPHDDRGMFLNRVKERVGLTLDAYDHHRTGYSRDGLRAHLENAGLRDVTVDSYCRFFSESIELSVNALYLKIGGGRKNRDDAASGRNEYRPKTSDDVRATGAAWKVYRAVFPVLRLVSAFDRLVPWTRGYVLFASARR